MNFWPGSCSISWVKSGVSQAWAEIIPSSLILWKNGTFYRLSVKSSTEYARSTNSKVKNSKPQGKWAKLHCIQFLFPALPSSSHISDSTQLHFVFSFFFIFFRSLWLRPWPPRYGCAGTDSPVFSLAVFKKLFINFWPKLRKELQWSGWQLDVWASRQEHNWNLTRSFRYPRVNVRRSGKLPLPLIPHTEVKVECISDLAANSP